MIRGIKNSLLPGETRTWLGACLQSSEHSMGCSVCAERTGQNVLSSKCPKGHGLEGLCGTGAHGDATCAVTMASILLPGPGLARQEKESGLKYDVRVRIGEYCYLTL